LGAKLRVLKTEGNLINEYGLPLTIFRLEDEDDAAVLEIGDVVSRRTEAAGGDCAAGCGSSDARGASAPDEFFFGGGDRVGETQLVEG